MKQWKRPLEPWERKALREYINDGADLRISVVEDIIRLAIASASRTMHACVPNTEVNVKRAAVKTTPAFEQRIVALFSE